MSQTGSKTRFVVATLTASDTRNDADDEGGALLRRLIAAQAGFDLGEHRIARENLDSLRETAREMISLPGVDALVVTGGTGLAPRDVTIEALVPLFDKEVPGFGEAFRRLSWDQIGPRAILSRAAMGVVGGRIVALLPGSPAAVELGVDAILGPVLGHAIKVARGEAKHSHPKKEG